MRFARRAKTRTDDPTTEHNARTDWLSRSSARRGSPSKRPWFGGGSKVDSKETVRRVTEHFRRHAHLSEVVKDTEIVEERNAAQEQCAEATAELDFLASSCTCLVSLKQEEIEFANPGCVVPHLARYQTFRTRPFGVNLSLLDAKQDPPEKPYDPVLPLEHLQIVVPSESRRLEILGHFFQLVQPTLTNLDLFLDANEHAFFDSLLLYTELRTVDLTTLAPESGNIGSLVNGFFRTFGRRNLPIWAHIHLLACGVMDEEVLQQAEFVKMRMGEKDEWSVLVGEDEMEESVWARQEGEGDEAEEEESSEGEEGSVDEDSEEEE
ncbi:hypothetical protein JCM8547_005786 [Rhodosporidiobolus lusitaniae]